MSIAVCPGSFDPITNGHLDIIRRASRCFDELVVLVTGNPSKPSGLFSLEERVELIRAVTAGIDGVRVDQWSGLLVDYTASVGASAIVKGLRSALDFEYEQPMAQINRRMAGIDTYFLMTDEQYGYVSSSLCKEVVSYGGDAAGLVPDVVLEAMRAKFAER